MSGPVRRYSLPVLVNLLIGLPAVVVLACARWYAANGHCDMGDLRRPDLDGCTYRQIDHSGPILFALVVSGAFVSSLVLIADVLVPLRRGRSPAPWLLTLPVVPLPYVVLVVTAR
ncbi:hypothetical protein ACF061_05525 [Streptomyces sp. NPDC015220]|uniref:hypothetical protein n=1 Tax=Streptomyces sp. NPDC015220 TaxID=3364947 RepID=UPI0036F58FAF